MNFISITMAHGEKGPRSDALQAYLLRHPDEYDFAFGDAEVDLVFAKPDDIDVTQFGDAGKRWLPGSPKQRAVELKMPADFVQSLQSGHLADQRRQCPYPLQVAVLGSLGDVMRALPEVTGKGWRNPREMAQAAGMIRRGIAALKASGVDVSFGLSRFDYVIGAFDSRVREPDFRMNDADNALRENMSQVVREARAYLESDVHLPRAKCESVQEAMLMCLPGVGPERARAILEKGIKPHLYPFTAGYDGIDQRQVGNQLEEIPGIGKKTAERILEAMR